MFTKQHLRRTPFLIISLFFPVLILFLVMGNWQQTAVAHTNNEQSAMSNERPATSHQPLATNCYAKIENGTVYSSTNATAVQTAVSTATAGELVKVAGTCVGVHTFDNHTQTVYISESVTLQGGDTYTN